ncbi:carboxypeptidase regulatory-like domain-containing protein [Hymenobacter sp. BT770]|uniref:TonB-dependent receptor n=1 Tax=Hymenobacter sp. BT770 TaxID=2886942 RepID=UPI001D12505B|nr:carboxypeptidase regulatory-like domain-containing protein [Hymenobacter sp. BT770]MCC3153826.1 carboxypeptidase regulatory-like domain-containing protein [Hymenobacter sp. BT770]MDO3415970.1 carboxypeptidase regulatory-like domain-containing protein [Hymenobacter sp. BT770]
MNNLRLRHLFLLALMLFTARLGWSQGATTAAMSGIITDKDGSALPGATVIAVHTPTNTQYVAPTNSDGRFNIQGMRVGGPYTVRVTFVGYQDVTRNDINLSLGQNLRLDVPLSTSTTELAEVQVSGRRDNVINASRTGAETNVSREQINQLPTLNRSLNDFTRLTPQAGGAGSSSFGGANNRYNNITIDGAVNNDVFGLAGSGTPGGQAGTNPIALDAIDQIQVVLAPYDVTLGNFTGAGVNAVTRSGSNDLSASIYGFGRNQNTIGKSVTEPRTKAADFSNYQTGFRVGGAIVKDKVFFFLNGEIARRNEPLAFLPGTADSKVTTADLERIRTASLNAVYTSGPRAGQLIYGGYDPGSYGDLTRRTESNKIFARLDFNISENNTLTLRHNFVKAFDDNITRASNNVRFSNNAYKFNNTTNSTVAELNSRFSGGFSNKLILTYTAIRDSRDVLGNPGPSYQISDNGNTYTLGAERSSVANQLDQDIVEITDNLTKSFGKHTITLGTHNEGFKFRNLFLNNGSGYYLFGATSAVAASGSNPAIPAYTGIQNFELGRSTRIQASYPTANNGEAKFKAAQLGFYVQDVYSPIESLRLTYGVRLDVPLFIDKPGDNTAVSGRFGEGYKTNNTPNGQLLFSPRLGFNWDVNNDTKVQLRGGTGIFSGRVPFVWISNSYTNSGLIQGSVDQTGTTASGTTPASAVLPTIYLAQNDIATKYNPVATSQINLTRNDFKLPQVWRSNLAVDFRLPGDVVATVEGIYSKTLNDIYYKDINLTDPVGRLAGPDQRPVYGASTAARRIDPRFTNVYLLDNTSKGYRYNATFQLQKRFTNGLNSTVAYTYGVSKEINSGSSSTASSNYGFNQVMYDPNNPELGYSRNDQRHRVIGSAGYTFRYANDALATTFTLFYEGLSGQPLTYISGQNSDLNRDGNTGNDLLYIPTNVRDANQIKLVPSGTTDTRTVAQIQDQFDAFIENDPYLRTHRGQIAERFAARLPWTHQIDVRVAQDFNFMAGGKKNSFQVTFDVQNVGNLLNNDWGRQYSVANNAVELLRVESTGPGVQPTFSFPAAFATTNRSYDYSPFFSRWQGQLGVRYSFN